MSEHRNTVIIVGGGAAGFFTAISIAEKRKDLKVIILEKSLHTLSKVKVSGGGRCNVTNDRSKPSELVPYYPRGNKKLYNVFKKFGTQDMRDWLAMRKVPTIAEEDRRVFPVSNSSQTIIDCFYREVRRLNIDVNVGEGVKQLKRVEDLWEVLTIKKTYLTSCIVIATGASPSTWEMLGSVGLKLIDPVPSLFTFKIKDERISGLPGVSFEHASVKIVGTKLTEVGPMLITHWGLSGPAVLKLSSLGALELYEKKYQFEILVNYLHGWTEADLRSQFQSYIEQHPSRLIGKYPLWGLPKRFWEQLLRYCHVEESWRFKQLNKKQKNKLIEELLQGRYNVTGKSSFKEEFVTAGGVDTGEIDFNDFSAKRFPGMYLAGEVLNIDALTGGFNFQACWSAGWLISDGISKSYG